MARLPYSQRLKDFCFQLYAFRHLLIVVLTPIVMSPMVIAFYGDEKLQKPMRCAYVLSIMIVYWTLQAIPIAITALLPVLLYPLLSIVEATDLAPKYMGESNLAFIASVIVVDSVEQVGLHKRLALKCLLVVGVQPRWLLFGFMATSACIAMWLQNSVTTALMVPIIFSVTDELRKAIFGAWHLPEPLLQDVETGFGPPNTNTSLVEFRRNRRVGKRKSVDVVATSMGDRQLKNMLLLAVAYSSSIGGVGTLIGTTSNLIMKQQVDSAYKNLGCESPLNFLSWMIYAVPISLVTLSFVWIVLLIRYYGPLYAFACRPSPIDKYRIKIRDRTMKMYDDLPPVGRRQYVVLIHIALMVVLMMTRQLNTSPLIGWDLIAPGYAKESTAAVLVAVSLYIFPISFPYRDGFGKWQVPETAVTWKETVKTIPFSVILLIGGGTAAAYGAGKSGFAELLSTLLEELIAPLDDWEAMCLFVVMIVFVTEFMSNYACVSLLMPVLSSLAAIRNSNPMFYMLPTTVAASFAFMFPVATPPNAEIFHAGTLRLHDMMSVGFFVNILGIVTIIGATLTYGSVYFDLNKPPRNLGLNEMNETVVLSLNCNRL